MPAAVLLAGAVPRLTPACAVLRGGGATKNKRITTVTAGCGWSMQAPQP